MALVYIVEDDPGIREIEEMALRNSNYIVTAFEKAAELRDYMLELKGYLKMKL